MIRKAHLNDIEILINLTKACARHLQSNGIDQWNEHYPNIEVFSSDITRNELYVLQYKKEIIGCVCLSDLMDDEYKNVSWITPNQNNCYIHRLAIHPNYQGIGKARLIMNFVEDKARQKQYRSIRLDTFSKNLRNQKFYELRGYRRLGNVYFLKQSKYPFFCYELLL